MGQVAQQAGLLLMTAAVTLGMVEVPEQSSKIVIPNQPSFALSHTNAGENNDPNNALRREREESGPHYTSYNITQRTPGRTGKR